jgi:hypothetical protein
VQRNGLDLDNYSSSAAFFDYDLDGDLDMYLLNHAVPEESLEAQRLEIKGMNVEILFRNDNGKFIDVSEQAGIWGANGMV